MLPDDLDKWIDAACEADPMEPIEIDDDDVISKLPLLSAAEIERARDDLAEWRAPDEFRGVVEGLCRRCRGADFFNDPHRQFLHDAWTLAKLVRHKTVDSVQLTPRGEQWPDGRVRIGDTTKNVEVTIALMPERRLGDEYRYPVPPKLDPPENWEKRAKQLPAAFEKAIKQKLDKRYAESGSMWLVVYLNISEWGIWQAECEAAIAEIKEKYSRSFGRLFVLWNEKLL